MCLEFMTICVEVPCWVGGSDVTIVTSRSSTMQMVMTLSDPVA